MPFYPFECKKCKKQYEELISLKDYDGSGKFPKVKCPKCGSKSKTKLLTKATAMFGDWKSSDKALNYDYSAEARLSEAQDLRRKAQQKSHMGANPYGADQHENFEGIRDA